VSERLVDALRVSLVGGLEIVCKGAAEVPDDGRQFRDRDAVRPGLEEVEELRLLLERERDGSGGAGVLECVDDRLCGFAVADFVEQLVAGVPGEIEGFAARRELDLDAVEAFRHAPEFTS
jgi:hypothetical protein